MKTASCIGNRRKVSSELSAQVSDDDAERHGREREPDGERARAQQRSPPADREAVQHEQAEGRDADRLVAHQVASARPMQKPRRRHRGRAAQRPEPDKRSCSPPSEDAPGPERRAARRSATPAMIVDPVGTAARAAASNRRNRLGRGRMPGNRSMRAALSGFASVAGDRAPRAPRSRAGRSRRSAPVRAGRAEPPARPPARCWRRSAPCRPASRRETRSPRRW